MRKFLFLFIIFFSLLTYADNHILNNSPFMQKNEVKEFIALMVKKYHFSEKELERIFSAVKPRPSVIRSTKYPLEKKSWSTYRNLYVTEKRITQGILFWNKYHDALEKAEQIYHVPASIIVATIGIESRYGQNMGEYPVIDALVNLGFSESARAPFFRYELEQFLLLTHEQNLDPLKVLGSYAGAIGQPQFMPSSYRHYGVHFANHPNIDLTNDAVDAIGSVANYYNKNGWEPNAPVAIPISMSGGAYQFSFSRPKNISLFELLESSSIDYSSLAHNRSTLLILQDHYGKEYWRTFHNFNVIKRYNHNNLYAMAVYQLSYHILKARGMHHD